MQALIGWLTGATSGLAAWLVVRAWPAPGQVTGAGKQPAPRAATGGWLGAVALPLLLASWGAYAGRQTGHPGKTALAVAFTCFLLLIGLVDLRTQRIPHLLLLPLLGLAPVQALWLGKPAPWSALLGLVAGGALWFILSLPRKGALGVGDLRLAAALGAMLGLPDIVLALAAGILAGGAGALWLLATRRAGPRDRMAYAPYLALGAWLVWTRSFGLWP